MASHGNSLFGLWLRRRRQLLDLSRKELAKRIGCSVSMVRKLESDQRRPSKVLARALAGALEVTAEEQDAFVSFARAGWADTPPPTSDHELDAPWRDGATATAAVVAGGDRSRPGAAPARTASPPLAAAPRLPEWTARPPHLVGRGKLLERMERAWDKGLTVILSGPGGIGKSRLMHEFARTHGPWIAHEGHPGDRLLPLSTVARLYRQFAAAEPEVMAGLAPWIRAEVSRMLPSLGDRPVPPIEGDAGRMRFFEAVYQATTALTRRIATLLVDDLQYYDTLSYELGAWGTGESVRRGVSTQTRTIAAFRPAGMPAEYAAAFEQMVAGGLAVELDVPPLDESGVVELLAQLGVADGAIDVDEVLRVTGGSPVYVIEAIKGWWETRHLAQLPGAAEGVSIQAGDVIQERLFRLRSGDLRLAQALALLDDHATIELLAAVTDEAPEDVTTRLSRLEEAKLALDLKFIHDVVTERVVATLARPERRYLHRRAARAIAEQGGEPAHVAHHLEQAGQAQEALAWRLEAASRALTNGSRTEARQWLEGLLQRAPEATQTVARASVLLGRTLLPSDLEGAGRAFASGLHVAQELALPGQEAGALAGLAQVEVLRGDEALARAHEEEASLIAEALPDAERARILIDLSQVRRSLGDDRASDDRAARAVALDPDHTGHRLELARHHWHHGRYEDAVRELHAVLRRDPDSARLTSVLGDLGRSYWALGRLAPALGWLRRALAVWSDSGDLLMEGTVRETLAAVYATRGWLGLAEGELVAAAALFRRQGAHGRMAAVDAKRAHLRLVLGRVAEAERICEHALAAEWMGKEPYERSMLLVTTSVARVRAGRDVEAQEVMERARALVGESGHPLRRAEALRCAATALGRCSPEASLARAKAALEIAERHRMREQAALAHTVLARQVPGDGAKRHARSALSIALEHHFTTVQGMAARRLVELGEDGMDGRATRIWRRIEADWQAHVEA